MMRRLLKVRWPELDKEVLIEPLEVNRRLFDWFLRNTPCRSHQGHAAVSGQLMYTKTIQIKASMDFKYSELDSMLLTEGPPGMVYINVSRGRAGTIMIKYGDITENMPYPIIGQVRKGDLKTLREVGDMVWDAFYNTKKIITSEFEEAGDV